MRRHIAIVLCVVFFSLLATSGVFGGSPAALVKKEQSLAAAEQILASRADGKAWHDWSQAFMSVAEEAAMSAQPVEFLQKLYRRGVKVMQEYAGNDTTGIRARTLWAVSLNRLAQEGDAILRQKDDELDKEARVFLHGLWLHLHETCQDYLIAEEKRGGLDGVLQYFFKTKESGRDTGTAWEWWWDSLSRYCERTFALAGREVALTKASSFLQQYTRKTPEDPYAWLAWSKMLLWQGEQSEDSVVRLACFEDAGIKYERLLSLDTVSKNSWAIWRETLERLHEACRSPSECDGIARLLEAYLQKMRQRFPD